MATQNQISQSMITQLRALDPSMSAETGTPERRIIDTVAQAIADAQVDLNVLNGAFDIDAKFGSDLDNMLAILGFGRQAGNRATGYVTFSRETTTTNPVIIRSGTTIFTPDGGDGNTSVVFRTTTTVTLQAGTTEVIAPIEAIQGGTIGNVAANTITETVGAPIYGITAVNNEYPITGGADSESDTELKARFTTAGPFRNLAGTKDQFLSLALSTKSKKANVVGPISKYSEYIQVPSVSDATSGGNGPSDKIHQFTTNLSNNNNSKHIYDNLPYFIANDSGLSPIYYTSGYDYFLNILPKDKNKGDAARYIGTIDPTSTASPVLYQPNVTFTNVYIGNVNTRPSNAIAPGDVLLFEHSYMSTASRNDYDRNILNCVDVYVNGEDATVANVTIPRPGSSVPTFKFTDDTTSAFYIDNYRRMGEPGRRPIKNNIFTPLYHQPVIDLPNQISLSNGTFNKDEHYWLVEEITDLNGTIRARNGIEWSATIPSVGSGDTSGGPYTGPYINNSSLSMATLATELPNSSAVSTTTNASNSSNQISISTSSATGGIATLTTSAAHNLNVGDTISISGITGSTALNLTSAVCTSGTTGSTIKYSITGTLTGDANTGKVTLVTIAATNSTAIKVTSTDPFPASGYILIGSEIISYSAKASNTFTVTGRGQFGTTAAAITASGATVSVLMEVASTTTKQFPNNDYLLIDSEQIKYSLPPNKPSSLLQIQERASNGSYVNSHVADSTIALLLTTINPSIDINNYQYDSNIVTLQSLLETNKQVTTDVLAHKAMVRYFKPDITIMYSIGANKASVNESIRLALTRYFDNVYFGNEIQLSDIIQTIHNVGGVDNVRWSKDVLEQLNREQDDTDNSRVRLVETNKYGDPISKPVLDLVNIGDGITATQYQLYLPYLPKQSSTALSAPTNLVASDYGVNASGTGLSNIAYYYKITAINGHGETTASTFTTVTPALINSSIKLTWNIVDGATGYRIYRNTSNSWTSGSLLLDEVYDELSYIDNGSIALTPGLPPTINKALTDLNQNYVVSNFQIQYGQNEPEVIEFDDFQVQFYSKDFSYSMNDIVLYGDKYYKSLVDNNLGKDPSTSTAFWVADTVNKIALTAKLNSNYSLVTASSVANFTVSPSFNHPITITYNNKTAKDKLAIVGININTGFGAYNEDFQIGDNELVALPEGVLSNGVTDISSVMTIRVKSQNTWNNIL